MHVRQINTSPTRRRCYHVAANGYDFLILTPDYSSPQIIDDWTSIWWGDDSSGHFESSTLEKALTRFDRCKAWGLGGYVAQAFHSAIIADSYDGAYDVQEVSTDV